MSLRLRGAEGSVAVSFDEQLVFFRIFGFSSTVSVHIFRFSVGRAERSAGQANAGTLTESAEI